MSDEIDSKTKQMEYFRGAVDYSSGRQVVDYTIYSLCKLFVIWAVISCCILWYHGRFDRDDSDGIDGERSGMSVHTDALTGCQYLSTPSGGVITRRDGAGRHVGCHTQRISSILEGI